MLKVKITTLNDCQIEIICDSHSDTKELYTRVFKYSRTTRVMLI